MPVYNVKQGGDGNYEVIGPTHGENCIVFESEEDASRACLLANDIYSDSHKLVKELWDWKNSEEVQSWFTMAHIHGSRAKPEFVAKVEDMNERVKKYLNI